jgi:hypothetical protein
VNKEASHYVRLFGGNRIGNLIFWLPLVYGLQFVQCGHLSKDATKFGRIRSHPSTAGHTGQTVIHIHPQHRYCLSTSWGNTTHWCWQWIAETCWGKICNARINKSYDYFDAFVGYLITILQNALSNYQDQEDIIWSTKPGLAATFYPAHCTKMPHYIAICLRRHLKMCRYLQCIYCKYVYLTTPKVLNTRHPIARRRWLKW